MTVDEFKAVINHYGEKNIIGFVFDNSSRAIMNEPGEFKMADHPIDAIGCLEFEETDVKLNPYKSVAHVENIQKVLVGVDHANYGQLDKRYLGS